jgi:hypothetical protein
MIKKTFIILALVSIVSSSALAVEANMSNGRFLSVVVHGPAGQTRQNLCETLQSRVCEENTARKLSVKVDGKLSTSTSQRRAEKAAIVQSN